jgi:hypothetical protein
MATAEPATAPAGYLDVADLDHVTYRELAERRAWLLKVISLAGPGANNAGARTAAVVLPTVLNELDTRARTYKAAADHSYSCSCGFHCTGLTAFDQHMDSYPPGHPDSDAHVEGGENPTAGQGG